MGVNIFRVLDRELNIPDSLAQPMESLEVRAAVAGEYERGEHYNVHSIPSKKQVCFYF